jgi:hypothetical protein
VAPFSRFKNKRISEGILLTFPDTIDSLRESTLDCRTCDGFVGAVFADAVFRREPLGLVLEAEINCRAEDARAVLLELIVEADLQILVDAEICNPKLAEMRCENIPLILEQLPLPVISTMLVLRILRPEYWRGRDVLFWTLQGRLLAIDLVRLCSSDPQIRSWEKRLLIGPVATGPGPKVDLEDQYEKPEDPRKTRASLEGS